MARPSSRRGSRASATLSAPLHDRLTLHDGAEFLAELQSPALTDKVSVFGPVNLADTTGSLLQLSLLPSAGAFTATPGNVFGLILNDDVDAVTGTFAGLAQGGTVNVSGHIFTISYTANLDAGTVGNDVALTYVVPEPGAIAMLLGGFGTLIGIRRVRRRN
jgi:hypothetical protein